MASGIKVLRELPKEDPSSVNQDETIDIVAIHGIGAHPDDTWTWKKPGEEACWLTHPEMLPKAIPNARIMRFGYKSVWYGRVQDELKKTKVSDVARMLLDALELNRRNITRPIIFIAHSYGRLVLIDALRRSFDHPDEWSNPFGHTAGLVFFGTPFRGRGGLSLNELVQRAAQGNPDSIMYPETMSLAAAENPHLEDIVSRFTETRRGDHPIPICSFYETLASPVGRTLGNKDVEDYYIVPEGSACLDESKGVERHPLERHHYNLQKFPLYRMAKGGVGRDTQYSIVENVIIGMTTGAKKYLEKCSTSNQHFNDVTRWLAAPDLSNNFNKAKMNRHPGSGQWFLQGEAYSRWKTQRNSFLWLHGILGCGKTILASAIIEDLKEQNTRFPTLLFFYFDFSDTSKQSFENVLRSLISQLYYKNKCLQELVDSLYSSCEHGRQQPSAESLHTTLLSMVRKAGEVWIVLDALDECRTRDECRPWGLFPCIQDLRDSQMNSHILVTSRPEQDIESAIKDHADEEDIISIRSDVIEGDINSYIHERVRKHKGLRRWQSQPSIQTEIEAALLEKANGMFRWISCQLDALEKCLDQHTLRRALKSLPKDLDETYARILTTLLENHKDYTVRLLQFLTYSGRPLRIDEVVDAIAVDLNERPRFDPKNRMPDPEEVFRYCSSLAVRVERKDENTEEIITEIQLAHVSVKDYLTSNRIEKRIARDLEETVASSTIAKVCLAYLIELDQNHRLTRIEKPFPLEHYAYHYWRGHVIIAERKNQMDLGILKEFLESSLLSLSLYYVAKITSIILYIALWATPWHQTLSTQILEITRGHYRRPQMSDIRGYMEITQMVLDKGADVNSRRRIHSSALPTALL